MLVRRSVFLPSLALAILFALMAAMGLAHALTPVAAGPAAAAKNKVDSAAKAYTLAEAKLQTGTGTPETVYLWSKRWADAQRANGVATAYADHTKRMISLETSVKTKIANGVLTPMDEHAAAYYRAEAEAGP